MRYLPALALLAACASDPTPAGDAGPPGDLGASDAGAVDAGTDTGQPADTGAVDTGAALDTGPRDTGAVDTDPRQSEVCRGVTAECDGRVVNVQIGERDGGLVHHCGACGVTCPAGYVCGACVCER